MKQANEELLDKTGPEVLDGVMDANEGEVKPSGFNMNDPDFQPLNPEKPSARKDTVTLEVPRDILRKVSLTNARLGIGAKSQVLALAEIINLSGGSPTDFAISTSTAKR